MFTFAKFCRLCLKDNTFLVKYTETDSNNISHCDKIKTIIPELIAGNCEVFPKWICLICREELDQFYTFYKKCLYKHKLLYKYLNQFNSMTNSSIISNSDSDAIKLKYSSSLNLELMKHEDFSIFDEDTLLLNFNSLDSNSPDINPPDSNPSNINPPDINPPDSNFPDSNPQDSNPSDRNPPDSNPPNSNFSDINSSNISIVKNEIPVTKEELNFKLFYETCLQSKSDTNTASNTDDNITNNQDENVIETVENKHEMILQGPQFSSNNTDQKLTINLETSLRTSLDEIKKSSNKPNIIQNVPPKSEENEKIQIIENNENVQNKESSLDQIEESIIINKSSWLKALKSQLDEDNKKSSKIKNPKVVSSTNIADNSGHVAEKSSNLPTKITEIIEIDSENVDRKSTDGTGNSSRLSLGEKRLSSCDEINNENLNSEKKKCYNQEEEEAVGSNIVFSKKRVKYTSKQRKQ